jgi:hypothetical protein
VVIKFIFHVWTNKNLATLSRNRWTGNRVTRLGEFSPNGQLFTMGSLMKIIEVAQIFLRILIRGKKSYILLLTKNGFGFTFWAIFSQGHLASMF